MPSTHLSLHYHLIFSTKDRAPLIAGEWRNRLHAFSWQEGYGASTVSASQRAAVKRYIADQEAHHRRRTFQEEYIEFLERHGVDYDETYLW